MINWDDEIEGICNHLSKVLAAKNKDYGNSFEKTVKDYGLVTIPITLEHKMRRIANIVRRNKIEIINEKLDDSLLDLAGYAILSVIIILNRRAEKWAKKCAKKQKKSKL